MQQNGFCSRMIYVAFAQNIHAIRGHLVENCSLAIALNLTDTTNLPIFSNFYQNLIIRNELR